MKQLFPHNQEAYERVMSHFEEGSMRAAVVHATGTGKSYIIGAVTRHFDRVLVIAPNNFVLEETRKVCKSGTEFRTYASVMYDETSTERYDLIVLDEFHRAGAEKWGEGVQRLLSMNPQAKLLGTSATHIRYLDGQRNMADELFDGQVVSHLPLKEALDRGILPTPTYVSSIYTMDDTAKAMQSRIRRSIGEDSLKEEQLRRLDGIAHNWDNAGGVPQIIRKYISHDMQRIIVFCSKIKRAAEARQLLSKWFGLAGFNRVRYYNIDYKEKRLEQEMQDFQSPMGEYDLKVAISVNMLNEGVHIPHVDGVIMLRSTISRIIIEQQVGRCLTSENTGITPVVLDLVNNMDLIRYDEMPEFGEWNGERSGDDKEKDGGFPFRVIDECRDLRVLLAQLDGELRMRWTYEMLAEEAKKYKTKSEFRKGSPSAYTIAYRYGIMDKICTHMTPLLHKWSEEELAQEALKYMTRKEFEVGSKNAYAAACRCGILDKICAHMQVNYHKWTEEELVQEALKYKTRVDFINGSPAAYGYARARGLLDKICAHMVLCRRYKWTDEELVQEALKYKTLKAFRQGCSSGYAAARQRSLLDTICAHMTRKCHRKWTNEELAQEALKYKQRTEFERGSSGAYCVARARGLLNEICAHMQVCRQKWTKEELMQEALKYETRIAFCRKSSGAYRAAWRRGILDKICAHMSK